MSLTRKLSMHSKTILCQVCTVLTERLCDVTLDYMDHNGRVTVITNDDVIGGGGGGK